MVTFGSLSRGKYYAKSEQNNDPRPKDPALSFFLQLIFMFLFPDLKLRSAVAVTGAIYWS